MEDHRNRSSRLTGTADSGRPPRLEKKPSRANISTPTIEDHNVLIIPPLDRTVDIVCHNRHHHGEPALPSEDIFDATLQALVADTGGRKPNAEGLLRLPAPIRFRIIQYLLPLQSRPVTLSRAVFTKAGWPKDSLRSLRSSISPLQRYLEVGSAFRKDILVAFLATTSFHVVLSPYVGPRMSPLATTWLLKYGPYMQHLTIELDMTKLGFGRNPDAAGLLPGLTSMEAHLKQIGLSQRKHRKVPLKQLILLCRRYYGHRATLAIPEPKSANGEQPHSKPQSSRASTRSAKSYRSGSASSSFHDPDSYETGVTRVISTDRDKIVETTDQGDLEARYDDQPYCPDECLNICNQLAHLQGLISSLRMSGFSEKYTHQFVATLFPVDKGRFACRLTPSGACWPNVKGQSIWIEECQGRLRLRENDDQGKKTSEWTGLVIPPAPMVHANGSLTLPPRNSACDTTSRPRRRTMLAPVTSSLSEPAVEDVALSSDKATKIRKLLDKCGVGKDTKKRALSRQTASTL